MHLHRTSLPSVIGFHHYVHTVVTPCSHRNASPKLGPLKLPVCLHLVSIIVCIFAVSPRTDTSSADGLPSWVCIHHLLQAPVLPPRSLILQLKVLLRMPMAHAATAINQYLLILGIPVAWTAKTPCHWQTQSDLTPIMRHHVPLVLGSSLSLSAGESLTWPKLFHKVWKRWLFFQMYRHPWKATGIIKSQGKHATT